MSYHECEYCECAQTMRDLWISLDNATWLTNITHHFDDKGNEFVEISAFKYEMNKLKEKVHHNGI